MTKKFKEKVQSVFSIFNIITLSIQSILPGFFVLFPTKALAVDQQVEADGLEYLEIADEFNQEIEASASVEFTLPEATIESETILADGILWLKNNDQATISKVELGVTYKAPQNNAVQVTFTKLPENPGSLTIRELTLSDEQVRQIGAYSSVAYDITSDMTDGSFEYELQLPLPEGADENSELKFAENVEELSTATAVSNKDVEDGNLVAPGLDHFTVFVVTSFEEVQTTLTTDGYNDIWYAWGDPGAEMTRVLSGTNGIVSSDGGYHVEINDGAFSRWDGYKSEFPIGGYDTRVDVYLDMALADGSSDYRIDFSSAINNPGGTHRRDFIAHLGTNPSVAGQWLASASNNSPGWPGNPAGSPADITETGWYTIEHSFRANSSNVLEVTISIYKKGELIPVGSWMRSDSSDVIGTTVGGNRYGWFVWNDNSPSWLAVDNSIIEYAVPIVTTIEIPKDNISWQFNRDITTASPYEFNTDQSSIGIGSLYAMPIANTYPVATKEGNDKFIAEDFIMSPIADINKITYDYKIGSGGAPSDANHFYMSVYANFGVSPDDKYYDCRYSVVPTTGSTSDFTTVTFDTSLAYPVATRTGGEVSPYTCPSVPADMDNLSPGSTIRVYALNMGDTSMNDTGLDGYFDNVIVDKGLEVNVYDFEPDLEAPATPTGLRRIGLDGNTYQCGDISIRQNMVPIWDANIEPDFSHYEYSSFNANGSQGLNEQILTAPTLPNTWVAPLDGTYGYAVRAVDTNGNKSSWALSDETWSGSCQITYDSTAPAVPTLIVPTNNSVVNGATLLSDWSTVSDADHYIYESYHDSGATNLRWHDEYTASEKSATNVANSTFWWRVKAVDVVGNESAWSELWKVTIDNTVPATPTINGFLNPNLACGSITNIHSTTVDWTDSSDNVGLSGYQYSIDYPLASGTGYGHWETFLTQSQYSGSLNEGIHTVKVRAKDLAGNYSAWSNECTITTDWTSPDVEITNPSEGFVNGIIDIRGSVVDDNPHHYWLVIQNPSGTTIAGPGTVNDTSSFTNKSLFSWNTASLPDGEYTIKLEARDAANNKDSASSHWLKVKIDKTLPTVDLVFPTPGGSTTSFQAVFSEDVAEADAENPANYYLSNWPDAGGSGDLLGDASIIYNPATKTATITFTNPGWYISPEQLWGVQNIHDLAGNLQQINAYEEYSTPLVAPVTTDSGIDSAWHNSSVTFNLNCTDVDGSGCKKTYYTTDDSDPTTASSFGNSVTLTVDSEYTIKYFSVDNAGNTEVVKTAANTVKIDSTMPSSTITTFDLPDEGQVETPTFDGLIEGTATDTGSDVDHVLLSISHLDFGADEIDREYWNATSSAWVATPSTFRATGTDTWSYQITPPENILEGTYVVSSHAVDYAGNVESTYTITIVYDKTIPTVNLTMDPTVPNGRNNWYVTKPTITLTANDNFDVDYIEYQWNSTTGSWKTYSGPITPPAEGQNILYYRSVDTVGNVSGIGVKEVKFDKTAPTDGAGNLRVENIGSTTADAKWDKPANSGEIDRFQLTWKHSDGSTRSTSVAGDVFEAKLFELFNGEWKLTLESQDVAGNSYSVTEDFTVGGSTGSSTSQGADQGADQGAVLGATDDLSGGTGGAFNLFQSQDQDQETEAENEEESTLETISNIDETGAVLGESDSACSTWKLYLPLFLLLLQTLLAFGFEIASRKENGIKLLIALLISGLMIGAFYFMRDPDCFSNGGMISTLAKWFVPVSLLLTFVMRWIASLTVEEN